MSDSTTNQPDVATTTAPELSAQAAARLEQMRIINPDADPQSVIPGIDPLRIPRHIAVIMDGNGRWAQERGFPRIFGHRNGAAAVRETVETCGKLGVEALTLYSFSSENWKRPKAEVDALMELCAIYCDNERDELIRENIRLRAIGRWQDLPDPAGEAIARVIEATNHCTGPTLCLALNYGARDEITRAVRSIAQSAKAGEIEPSDISDELISANLDTAGLPDPDLLIRTAGEKRLSNYLLWQLSYAELYIADVLWPEFNKEELCKAIQDYASRNRRFGGLNNSPS